MPTTMEINEAKAWLKGQGFSVDMIYRPAQRVQWYRADGSPLPNLLPCDNYHLRLYRGKGWTLKPPDRVEISPGEQTGWEKVVQALKAGPKTIRDLVEATGIGDAYLRATLANHKNQCLKIKTERGLQWELASEQG